MSQKIDDNALRQLFLDARTQNKWQAKDVTDDQLRQILDILKFGPTSMNMQPARFVFLRSKEAKERLKPFLTPGNVDKTMSAPVTAIIGHDLRFFEKLPQTFPHRPDAKNMYEGKPEFAQTHAFRNGSLQGAYFMLAARAIGLDIGGMSGFNNAGVDGEFFAGTDIKSNFLCNVGYGDPSGVMERLPRLSFDEYAKII